MEMKLMQSIQSAKAYPLQKILVQTKFGHRKKKKIEGPHRKSSKLMTFLSSLSCVTPNVCRLGAGPVFSHSICSMGGPLRFPFRCFGWQPSSGAV